MSTNLHLSASRAITVNTTGKTDIQYTHYNLWQTPTSVTTSIMLSDNLKQAYKDYVMSITEDYNELVYASDDIFCEESPIGTRVVHNGKNECDNLDAWITLVEEQGYVIKFDAW